MKVVSCIYMLEFIRSYILMSSHEYIRLICGHTFCMGTVLYGIANLVFLRKFRNIFGTIGKNNIIATNRCKWNYIR